MSQTDEDGHRRGVLNQLRWSLQALACDADTQRALFPDFVCKADELALDFDHWLKVAQPYLAEPFHEDQLATLAVIDGRLDAMSRGGPEFDEDLWAEAALSQRPQWEEVRSLARTALAGFGWPLEVPPRGRAIYGSGDRIDPAC